MSAYYTYRILITISVCMSINAIAPIFVIVISIILIVATLVKAAAKRNKLLAGTSTDDPQLKSTNLMLICISVACVLLTSPAHISLVLEEASPDDDVTSVKAANHRLR